MTLGGATVLSPPPTPTTEPDPFNPDVTIWPEAPDWLFPTVMVFTGLIIAAVVVLLERLIQALRLLRVRRVIGQSAEDRRERRLDRRIYHRRLCTNLLRDLINRLASLLRAEKVLK